MKLDLTNVSGVIFDLDGTLVESVLDFSQMRREIGCPAGEDILTFIDNLPDETSRASAHQIILDHEMADAENAKWLPAGKSMVDAVIKADLPVAIVTRNCKQATALKISNNQIPISTVLTRECAPAKPDPTALLMIAGQWQIAPAHILYVGDYIYDQQAAENAGMQWLLV